MPNFHLAASNANLLTNYNQNNVISQTSLQSSYSRILLANLGYQINKNSNHLPKDTKGLIPKDLMDIMIGYSKIVKLENGGFADFTKLETSLILSYLIKIFYLGYDEGKYSVVYGRGEILTIEQSSEFNKSNTQGTEETLGGTIGKDATGFSGSATGSKKWSENNSKAIGEGAKRTLGATKYNELKSLGFNLADDYQKLIVKLDKKERVCYNNDPLWKISNKSMYKATILKISNWIDFIGFEIRITFGRSYGDLAAKQTNVN